MDGKIRKPVAIATVVVMVVLVLWNLKAYGSESESVVFLLGDACNMHDLWIELIDAHVVCHEISDWKEARAHLYGFEEYYNVVYVTQDNQHPLADKGVRGQAWFRDGDNYAYSTNNLDSISHELLHLVEKKHFTSDGRHDSEKGEYPWLWKAERG